MLGVLLEGNRIILAVSIYEWWFIIDKCNFIITKCKENFGFTKFGMIMNTFLKSNTKQNWKRRFG